MRRTQLKRKTPLRSRTWLKSRKILQKASKSPIATLKKQIQAQLREYVIYRDGGCFLRVYEEAGACGGYRKDGELILQAEHLNGRSNSVSYGETDNLVCLCQRHHIYFKPQNSLLYWELVRKHIGEEKWKKVQVWVHDQRPHRMTERDWINTSLYLRQKIKDI